MLDFKVLLLVKKAMSPQWHSDDGPGPGSYLSHITCIMYGIIFNGSRMKHQNLLLGDMCYHLIYGRRRVGCSPFIRELDDSCVLVIVMAQRIS